MAKHRKSALHKAVLEKNPEAVRKLITRRADVNAMDNNGNTPLHLAIKSKNIIIIKLLVEAAGLKINAKNHRRITPLHLAVESKNEEVLKILLKNKNIDVNVENLWKYTPLYLAAESDNEHFVKLLLEAGADVNTRENPFYVAALRTENSNIIKLLLKAGANVNSIYNSETPLHAALSIYANAKIVKLLLKSGARLTIKTAWDDFTPILLLIDKLDSRCDRNLKIKYLECLEVIMEYTEINLTDQSGTNILGAVLEKTYSSYNKRRSFQNIILQQISKLKALDYEIDLSLQDVISAKDDYNKYFAECEQELEKAKKTKLQHCWVSFFNLLVDGKSKFVKYAGNQDLLRDFEKNVQNFSIYGCTMQKNLSKGIKRRKLWDGAANSLSYHLPIFNSTHLIIKDVLDVLNKQDLRNLCEMKRYLK